MKETNFPSSQKERDFLPALTSIRFFGATVVVIFHAQGLLGVPKRWLNNYGVHGFMALFFVISGFVMLHSYPAIADAVARRKFYISRFARIWPLHFVTFLLAFFYRPPEALWEFTNQVSIKWLAAALNLFLVQAWLPLPWSYFSFNDLSWSISAEVFFYLTFPIVLITWRKHWLRWYSFAFALTFMAIVYCYVFKVPVFKSNPNGFNTSSLFHVNPFVRWLEFITGMLAALIYERYQRVIRSSVTSFKNKTIWSFLEAAIFIFFVLNLYCVGVSRETVTDLLGTGAGAWVTHSGILPGCFLLVLILAIKAGWLTEFLSMRFFVLLGEASFSMYLLHAIPLQMQDVYEQNWFSFLPKEFQFVSFLTLLTAVSFLSWKFFEMPVRRKIVQALNRK